MKCTIAKKSMAIAMIASTYGALAADYTAPVGQLQALTSSYDCFYFTLSGVPQADPITPGNPWFAVARDQYGSKDAYAMLLSAKLSSTSVRVTTTGQTICGGYAQVSQVIAP